MFDRIFLGTLTLALFALQAVALTTALSETAPAPTVAAQVPTVQLAPVVVVAKRLAPPVALARDEVRDTARATVSQ